MGYEKRLLSEPIPISKDCAARAQKRCFMNEVNARTPRRSRDVGLNLIGEPMGVQKRAFNAAREHEVEPIVEQRPTADLHQAFWRGVREWAQPAPDSGCEQ